MIIRREALTKSSSVEILPPLSGRDVLAVGKNYMDHAHEFNSSGYDSWDKVARPTHPVIFTKRASSIIAHEQEVYLDEEFTSTLDYEGEIGVIIGKGGYKISEADAKDHVWGYTIINDVTAREKQRDHKQFYIGELEACASLASSTANTVCQSQANRLIPTVPWAQWPSLPLNYRTSSRPSRT